MKKFFILVALALVQTLLLAQTVVRDSISLGAPITQQNARPFINDSISLGSPTAGFSYPNDVFYNMQNGNKTTVVGYNWHLAFAVRKALPPNRFLQSATILANEGRGVSVYQSNSNWGNFDTAGFATWANPHNSDSSWDVGALNANRSMSNPFDFGWGTYDMVSHNITGNKVYLVRISVGSGQTAIHHFKKLWVQELMQDSIWTFTYANINNTDSMTVHINKANYTNKLFAYHNMLLDSTMNREPNTKWDVLFTRYGAFATQFGQTIFSSNTGVLTHPSVMSSMVAGVPVSTSTPGLYTNKITGIGTDWKKNPGPGQPNFLIIDSLSYFTKDAANLEHKLIFTGFTGSSTGVISFRRANTAPLIVTLESYPNDVFYNMANGEVSTVRGANWHLAFAIRNAAPPLNVMRSTTILANEGRGVSVFVSPNDVTEFANFDTTGFRSWINPHNSENSWDIGALNAYRDSSNGFDFGWGEYSQVSHDLEATKMFLVRITQGSGQNTTTTFKKIKIDKLSFDTSWIFTYANVDGSNSKTITINKPRYAGKLFAYHNLLNDSTHDREPAAKWDVLFTRYGAFYTQFGQTIFSTNTGVLSHPLTLTSKVKGVAISQAEPGVYTHNLTGIGTDWKENPGPGQPNFRVYDSLSYFTKTLGDREDKLVFETFRGASTGVIIFNKTNIKLGTGLSKVQANNAISMYPNPANESIQFSISDNQNYEVSVVDLSGKTLVQQKVNAQENKLAIDALQTGFYLVRIANENTQQVIRLIKN
ncbi:MAG: T9SS type A sorting domain-containing protein [Bacteroidota bacterium]|nr:T9SS type A sorting domain-containing protein [Bacteroidota bacterium]